MENEFNYLDQDQVKHMTFELNDDEMFIGSAFSFDIQEQKEILGYNKDEKKMNALHKRFGI